MAVLPFRVVAPGTDEVQAAVLAVAHDAGEEGVRKASIATLGPLGLEETSIRLARVAYAPDAPARREQARALLDEAWQAYFNLDVAIAKAKLTEASGRLQHSPQMPEDLALLSDLRLLAGLMALASDPKAAQPFFDSVVRLTPARTLDPKQFPPHAIAALAAAKQRLEITPVTTFTVETNEGSWISIDGLVRGQANAGGILTMDRLPAGEHFYRVEKAFLQPRWAPIDIPPAAVHTVKVSLDPVSAQQMSDAVVARTSGAKSRAEVSTSLARLLAADRVLLVAISSDGPRRYSVEAWWGAGDGSASAPVAREIDAEPAAFREQLTDLARDVLAAPALGTPHPEHQVATAALARDVSLLASRLNDSTLKPPPPVWWKRRTVQLGVAAVIAAGAIGYGGYVVAQPGSVDYRASFEGDEW